LLLPININLHGQHNNSLVYTRTWHYQYTYCYN
jgi:hypothetical protein